MPYRIFYYILSGFILLFFQPYQSESSTRGKLVGVITDLDGNQPLAGVNIYLENTILGAASNEDGQFIIINILPGTYTVIADFVGYTTKRITNVKIETNRSTVLSIELSEQTLESSETITVLAEKPLIRPDVTSKLAIISGDEIVSLPVDNFNDVVASQAGITTDARGNLHFRGGRTNEVTFLLDGQPMKNPVNNTFSGLVDNYAIRELQILSGTFNAEYGQAMSGIINIVTNDGSEKIQAKLEYTSANLNVQPYRKPNALVQDANPIYDAQNERRLYYSAPNGLDAVSTLYPYEGSFNGFLSGPVPAGLGSFFVSGEYNNQNSWLPFGYDFTRSLFGKWTIPFASNKLSISVQLSDVNAQPYNHSYKYLPANYGHWEIQSNRYAAQYNHVLSKSSYFVVNASMIDHQSLYRVGDLHYDQYIFPELDAAQEFFIAGNDKSWSRFKSTTYNLKTDWLWQYNLHHEFKSGFELNVYDLDVFDYSKEGNNEGEFFLNEYKKQPFSASGYVQGKIEFKSIIINLGLRADYIDVKSQAYRNIENPLEGLKDTKPELKFSPRLGVAYPISENTVFHFSYGHFFQFPDFQQIYRNLQFLNPEELARAKLALVANPAVKSQKTTSYEFGLSTKMSKNTALKVTAYSKDIIDLLGTIYVETLFRYSVFTNNDFARIQGIDISYEKRMSNYWAAKFDYTLSVAKGNEATATEEAYNIFEGRPRSIKEFYLDFDRRHDFSINLSLFLPDNYGPQLLGIQPLSNIKFSMLAQFSSGLPYTPISDDRTKYFEKNSGRMPWTKSIDIRLEKFIPTRYASVSLFLEATNIFDWLSPLIVQPRTGKVWDDGKSYLFGSGEDFRHKPSHVAPPRLVKLGASVSL